MMRIFQRPIFESLGILERAQTGRGFKTAKAGDQGFQPGLEELKTCHALIDEGAERSCSGRNL